MNQRVTLRPSAKLSDRVVVDMRKRFSMGMTTAREEAVKYGVGVETIRRALRGDTFQHLMVEGAEPLGVPRPIAQIESPEEMMESAQRMMRLQEEIRAEKGVVAPGSKEVLAKTSWAQELLGQIKAAPESVVATEAFGELVAPADEDARGNPMEE